MRLSACARRVTSWCSFLKWHFKVFLVSRVSMIIASQPFVGREICALKGCEQWSPAPVYASRCAGTLHALNHIWNMTVTQAQRISISLLLACDTENQRLWSALSVLSHNFENYCKVIIFICHMEVSWNGGTPKSSILVGCSMINQPIWGTPYLWKPRYGDGFVKPIPGKPMWISSSWCPLDRFDSINSRIFLNLIQIKINTTSTWKNMTLRWYQSMYTCIHLYIYTHNYV